ncbi:MAG: molybdate ABC transporter substrate-binding protein [Rhodobacter sp.]|nr:molybdate ABC transporter substrate-binding protein [Rhodobacter sp.]
MRRLARVMVALSAALWLGFAAQAGQATVAVAANFLTTAERLAEAFTRETGHEVSLVHGSTGKLYAQIVSGAPFDLFLAADTARPERLEADGRVAPEGRTSYAEGRLALVLRGAGRQTSIDAYLADPSRRLALADPAVAPYGLAAREVLLAVRGGNWAENVVLGESVGQALAFLATGNAPAGLVALPQAGDLRGDFTVIPVPAGRHAPIRQDAVLLRRGADNPAARGFFAFLGSEPARAIIRDAGFGVSE